MVKSGTIILNTAARFLMPLQLMFSIFLLLRGHDEPGGGFIAGLVAAGAFTLYLFAFGVSHQRSAAHGRPPRPDWGWAIAGNDLGSACLVYGAAISDSPVVDYPGYRL